MPMAQLTVMVSALLGWSDIQIQASRPDRAIASYRSVAGLDRPTERTLETLKRYDLEREYRRNLNNALLRIEKFAQRRPEAELVYALAELSWIEGKRLDRWRKPQALDRFLDAAAYAHDYLFETHPVLVEGRSPSDPRYRQAMEIYNGSVDHLIRAAMTKGHIQPQEGEVISFKFHGREEKLRIVLKDSPWKSSDVHKILLASDFEVSGLNRDFNQYGLGVPLIGVREAADKVKDRAPQERFYPTEMAFPLTAFLVPNARLLDPNVDVEKTRVCTLWLIDPVRHRTVGPDDKNQLALEIDLTTPLAYMWSRTDLERFRWSGLLRPEKGLERANLLLLRPYEPGKIPVVMVHGLISTPLAWIPMLNELQRNSKIQDKYQFLLYMYPTGVPIPIAAASLREDLIQAKQMYNPDGRDSAFDRMVLLGHSMGGLLSHMMALDSGDKLWRLYSDRSFDDLIGSREVIEELRHYLYFKPLPFVSRVVFLATPHRGSAMSRGVIGRVGTSLISDPDNIHKLLYRLAKDNDGAFDTRRFRRFPTSIETLETNSPILMAIDAMEPSRQVSFHSIIGSYTATGIEQSTDGVVPYRSAHLDGAVSEKVVRSDHGVQKDSEAIIEVQRILLEHLGATPVAREARAPRGSAPVPLESLPPLR